jgi:hypothetical protein
VAAATASVLTVSPNSGNTAAILSALETGLNKGEASTSHLRSSTAGQAVPLQGGATTRAAAETAAIRPTAVAGGLTTVDGRRAANAATNRLNLHLGCQNEDIYSP